MRPPLADRGPEADLALLLAAEDAAAQRDQDAAAPPRRPRSTQSPENPKTPDLAQPLVDQVRRRRAGRAVVHPHVGDPLAERQVAHQRDHRDARLAQAQDRGVDLGRLRRLEDHPAGAPAGDRVQDRDDVARVARLAEIEPRPHDRGPQRRKLLLQRGLDRGGEPVRGLHHDVDHEHPAGQPQLAALLVQVGDGLPDVVDGARAHAAAVVEDAVHGGLAHAGLAGDLADRVRVGHAAILMGC